MVLAVLGVGCALVDAFDSLVAVLDEDAQPTTAVIMMVAVATLLRDRDICVI